MYRKYKEKISNSIIDHILKVLGIINIKNQVLCIINIKKQV